jgi:prepilin-type N-terminal cleavage/methylation domain-containing protein
VASGKWQVASGKWQNFLQIQWLVKNNMPHFAKKTSTCHPALVAGSGAKITAIACSPRSRNKCGMTAGFTLIELSIVLVIIGLLVGGILVGRDLIKAAEIRSQISQFQQIETAHNTFKQKYNCMAGDCPQTSALFPQITGLDGNGNGQVECWYGGATVDECRSYFYSFVLAGLMAGSQTYIDSYAKEYYKGKMRDNSTIYVNYTDIYERMSNQSAVFVHLIITNSPAANGAVITSEDAYQIDVKIDDGKAGSGKVYGINGGKNPPTTYLPCIASGEYDLTKKGINCEIMYKVE